ncbi:uncharacterized protein [Aristolochia californica]|uniref:uncharacterized protein isoform X1 n=1 Tax=Aristolochia californica TaxID=171875 RepID=UPI0035DF3FAE
MRVASRQSLYLKLPLSLILVALYESSRILTKKRRLRNLFGYQSLRPSNGKFEQEELVMVRSTDWLLDHFTIVLLSMKDFHITMRVHEIGDAAKDYYNKISYASVYEVMDEPILCRFFVNGSCKPGSQCLFSHSLQGKTFVNGS